MSDALVVDASVAVKWVAIEPDGDRAQALVRANYRLIAPAILLSEVTNAVWKKCLQGKVSDPDAHLFIRNLPRFFERVVDTSDLLERALSVALELRHPVYDFIYVLLADHEGIQMITADTRLLRCVENTRWAARVCPLADWEDDRP